MTLKLNGIKVEVRILELENSLKTADDCQPEVIALSFTLLKYADRLTHYIQDLEKSDHSSKVIVDGRLISSIEFKEFCSLKTLPIYTLDGLNKFVKTADHKADSYV